VTDSSGSVTVVVDRQWRAMEQLAKDYGEDYHQDYFSRRSNEAYCRSVVGDFQSLLEKEKAQPKK
jgi:hypothetical protein